MLNEGLWILAMVVFLVLEASTSAMVSIWFAGGALGALIATLCGANVAVQVLVFFVVSLGCMFFLRKVAMKQMKGTPTKTNLDRIVGQNVRITTSIDPLTQQGATTINDVEWKVKSADGTEILAGETVTVVGIEGVKLIVRK